MSINNLKITFELDGTGIYYDPNEPIHLDALLAWALAPYHCKGEPPSRDEEPFDIPLPLDKWYIDGTWGWKASVLFPEGLSVESLQFWRKRFRQSRAELVKGSANLQSGVYRDYNNPIPLLLCRKMVAYAVGDRGRVDQILRKHIKFLGKKRAYGKGKVISVSTEIIEQDFSMQKEGVSTRFLPSLTGQRFCRVRPPYWNNCQRLFVSDIGQKI